MGRRYLTVLAFVILGFALPAKAQGGPDCNLNVSPDRGDAPLTVTATANCQESNNIIVQMTLDWGDGSAQIVTVLSSISAQHVYNTPGRFTVTVVGTDLSNNQGTASRDVRVDSPPNHSPSCSLNVSPNNGPAPLTVTANGNCSDPDGNLASVSIDWGDGTSTPAGTGTHTYPNPGNFTVTVTATDSLGNTGRDTATVRVTSANAPPTCTLGVNPLTGPAPLSVTASGNCTDPENDIRTTVITWGDGTSTPAVSGTHIYTNPGVFTVTLTATDSAGATGSAAATVTVTAGPPASQPPSCTLSVTPNSGEAPLLVNATATCTDPNQDISRILLDFGDGFYHSGATFSHTYVSSGNFTVTVVATDQAGHNSAPASKAVNVVASPALFVGVSSGKISQFTKSGTFVRTLDSRLGGSMTGMGFDSVGTLFATNFTANAVSRFSGNGTLVGTFGSGYNCKPQSVAFDRSGNVYVGETGCSHALLKFDAYGNLAASYAVTTESQGSDWVDIASDQCTVFYTSEGPSVLRFNACSGQQQPAFSSALKRGLALRILPDGGVLVANNTNILRLNSSGSVVTTYTASGENCWSTLSLDEDGSSFWAADYCTSDVVRFDLDSGNQLFKFNTGTPTNTVFGVAARPIPAAKTPAGPLIPAPAQATIGAGQNASFNLTFATNAAADGRNFTLFCANLPAGASCTFSPDNVTGGNGTSINLTIKTSVSSSAALPLRMRALVFSLWLPLGVVLIPRRGTKGRKLQAMAVVALVVLVAILLACGGGNSSNNNSPGSPTPAGPTAVSATPSGTYTVVIHAVSGSLESATSVQLAVQ